MDMLQVDNPFGNFSLESEDIKPEVNAGTESKLTTKGKEPVSVYSNNIIAQANGTDTASTMDDDEIAALFAPLGIDVGDNQKTLDALNTLLVDRRKYVRVCEEEMIKLIWLSQKEDKTATRSLVKKIVEDIPDIKTKPLTSYTLVSNRSNYDSISEALADHLKDDLLKGFEVDTKIIDYLLENGDNLNDTRKETLTNIKSKEAEVNSLLTKVSVKELTCDLLYTAWYELQRLCDFFDDANKPEITLKED